MSLQIGIVGTGNFSKLHAGILEKMEDVRIQAVCGTSKEKAEKFASQFNHAHAYEDVQIMLDSEKLDAVYICVPPMTHGKIEMEVIERYIPLFVEKPLGINLDLPTEIVRAIEDKSLITSVGYHFRYKKSSQQLKEMLENQKIGMAIGQWMGGMPMVPWWRNQQGSGGQFNEQTTHLVDLLRFTAGEVEEVFAMFGNQVMHEKVDSVTVADIGTVSLKLRNGSIATLSNTCIMPKDTYRCGLTFYTDQSIIDWQFDGLQVKMNGEQSEIKDQTNPYEVENEAFIHAIRTKDTSRILSNYENAYKTQEVTSAAFQSAATGKPIKLNA
ncbi:Gfo/Idh/MocA family protein [Halalkalibacter kiskunsagensis]|uniref:Gfo/Idh/MocA family protein n=1 Tax=Halalkalibacter kiskunsagensis TaxID=1548599 RepID=A0ABV6KIK6_9BACI